MWYAAGSGHSRLKTRTKEHNCSTSDNNNKDDDSLWWVNMDVESWMRYDRHFHILSVTPAMAENVPVYICMPDKGAEHDAEDNIRFFESALTKAATSTQLKGGLYV